MIEKTITCPLREKRITCPLRALLLFIHAGADQGLPYIFNSFDATWSRSRWRHQCCWWSLCRVEEKNRWKGDRHLLYVHWSFSFDLFSHVHVRDLQLRVVSLQSPGGQIDIALYRAAYIDSRWLFAFSNILSLFEIHPNSCRQKHAFAIAPQCHSKYMVCQRSHSHRY